MESMCITLHALVSVSAGPIRFCEIPKFGTADPSIKNVISSWLKPSNTVDIVPLFVTVKPRLNFKLLIQGF